MVAGEQAQRKQLLEWGVKVNYSYLINFYLISDIVIFFLFYRMRRERRLSYFRTTKGSVNTVRQPVFSLRSRVLVLKTNWSASAIWNSSASAPPQSTRFATGTLWKSLKGCSFNWRAESKRSIHGPTSSVRSENWREMTVFVRYVTFCNFLGQWNLQLFFSWVIGWSQLKELLDEAKKQRFPEDREQVAFLRDVVDMAERFTSVAQQLVSAKVRTRTRLQGEAKCRLTLEELQQFVQQLKQIPCKIAEAPLIFGSFLLFLQILSLTVTLNLCLSFTPRFIEQGDRVSKRS